MENCSPGRKHRVKRCLFGKPDSEEVEKWLSDTTEKHLKSSRAKWNYDFQLDQPISGDVEYEIVSAEKVPAVYKPTSAGRRKTKKVIEFDPSVPSVSSSEELKSEPGSVPRRPRTRSCTKQQSSNGSESPRSWKQAKLTNYLKVRKRRSIEQRTPKDAAMPLKSLESVAPSSPFRFVADGESRRAIDDEGSPRSSSSSPPKSPRKRPAQKLPPSSPRLPKLRSHAVANH